MRKDDFRAVVRVLKALARGQGFADIGVVYDSAWGELTFSLSVSRERDGLWFGRTNLTRQQFQYALEDLSDAQPCGHPRSAIVGSDEGTNHCSICEKEANNE